MSLLGNTSKSSGIHCELFVQQTVIIGMLDVVYRCGIKHAEVSAVVTAIHDAQQFTG